MSSYMVIRSALVAAQVQSIQSQKDLPHCWELLIQYRNQPIGPLNDGLLRNPELLVLAAEAAIVNGLFDLASAAIEEFFSWDGPLNHIHCRALFAKALITNNHVTSEGLTGAPSIQRRLAAVNSVLEAVAIAQKNPEYSFIVYNASVHLWKIVRPSLRPGAASYFAEALQTVVDAVEQSNEQDLRWRILLHLAAVQALSDKGEATIALQRITTASTHAAALVSKAEAAVTTGGGQPEHQQALKNASELQERVWLTKAQLAYTHASTAADLKKTADVLNSDTNVKNSVLVTAQQVACGTVKGDAATALIQKALNKLNTSTGMNDADQQALLADLGRASSRAGLKSLAQTCLDTAKKLKPTNPPAQVGTRVKLDYLAVELTALELDGKVCVRGESSEKVDVNRASALRLLRRIEGLKSAERALQVAQRVNGAGAADLILDGCILILYISQPLLQKGLRHHASRALSLAVSAWESTGSPLMSNLKARLHLELAKCELESDFVARASTQVTKVLRCDYGTIEPSVVQSLVNAAPAADWKKKNARLWNRALEPEPFSIDQSDCEEADTDKCRALDRYAIQLAWRLQLKLSVDSDKGNAVSWEARAALLLDQAADASRESANKKRKMGGTHENVHTREEHTLVKTLLLQAVDALDRASAEAKLAREAEVPPTDAETTKDLRVEDPLTRELLRVTAEGFDIGVNLPMSVPPAGLRRRMCLYYELAKASALINCDGLTQRACVEILMDSWNPTTAPEIIIMQARTQYLLAETLRSSTCLPGMSPNNTSSNIAGKAHIPFLALRCIAGGLRSAQRVNAAHEVEMGVSSMWTALLPYFEQKISSETVETADTDTSAILKLLDQCCTVLEAVQSTNTSLICKVTEALALLKEQTGDLPGAESTVAVLCKPVHTRLKPTASQLRGLYEVRARCQRTNGNPAAVTLDGSDLFKALCLLAGGAEHPAAPPAEKSTALSKGVDLMKKYRKELISKDTADDKDTLDVMHVLSTSNTSSYEDDWGEADLIGNVYCRLAKCALSIGQPRIAQECCNYCLELLPRQKKSSSSSSVPPPAVGRWLSIAECLWGQAIASMVAPTSQDETLQDELRVSAMAHFARASAFAYSAGIPTLTLESAYRMWNEAVAMSNTQAGRQSAFPFLKKVLEDLGKSGADQSNGAFCLQLALLSCQCYSDTGDWKGGLDALLKYFTLVPPELQRPLWKWQSRLGGKGVVSGLARTKESNPELQARVMAALARSAALPQQQLEAYNNALDILDGHVEQVHFLVEMSGWMLGRGLPVQHARELLDSGLDMLYALHDPRLQPESTDSHAGPGANRNSPSSKSQRKGGKLTANSHTGGQHIEEDNYEKFNSIHMDVGYREVTARILGMVADLTQDFSERRRLLLEAHYHVASALHDMCDTAARRGYSAHPEKDKLTLEEWKKQEISRANPSGNTAGSTGVPYWIAPKSLAEWTTWVAQPELVTSVKEEPQGLERLGNQVPSSILYLLTLSESMCTAGLHTHALAPLACAEIYADSQLPAVHENACLLSLIRMRKCRILFALGVNTCAYECMKLAHAQLDMLEARKCAREALQIEKQRKGAENSGNGSAHELSLKNGTSTSSSVPPSRLETRHLWVKLAGEVMHTGRYTIGGGYLTQASIQASAYMDVPCMIECLQGQATLALSRGQDSLAQESLEQALSLGTSAGIEPATLANIVTKLAELLHKGRRTAHAKVLLTDLCATLRTRCMQHVNSHVDVHAHHTQAGARTSTLKSEPSTSTCEPRLDCCVAWSQCVIQFATISTAGTNVDSIHIHECIHMLKQCEDVLTASGGMSHPARANLLQICAVLRLRCIEGCSTNTEDSAEHSAEDSRTKSMLEEAIADQSLAVRVLVSLVPGAQDEGVGGDFPSTIKEPVLLPMSRKAGMAQLALSNMLLKLACMTNEHISMDDARAQYLAQVTPVQRWLDSTATNKIPTTDELKPSCLHMALAAATSGKQLLRGCERLSPCALALEGTALSLLANAAGQNLHAWTPGYNHANKDIGSGDAPAAVPQAGAKPPAEVPKVPSKKGTPLSEEPEAPKAVHLKEGESQLKSQAIARLEQAISEGTAVKDYDSVKFSAYALGDMLGMQDPLVTAVNLLHAQSCKAHAELRALWETALGGTNAAKLHIMQLEKLTDHAHFPRTGTEETPASLSRTFLESSAAPPWRRLDCTTPPLTILKSLTHKLLIISLTVSPDRQKVYAVCANRAPPGATVEIEVAVCEKILEKNVLARACATQTALSSGCDQLATHFGDELGYDPQKNANEPQASTSTSGGVSPAAREAVTHCDQLFADVCMHMESLFGDLLTDAGISRMLAHASTPAPASKEDPKDIVLILDTSLAQFPIEALVALNKAKGAISRDFSVHMLHHRLTSCPPQGEPVIENSRMAYICDPLQENAGHTPKQMPAGSLPPSRPGSKAGGQRPSTALPSGRKPCIEAVKTLKGNRGLKADAWQGICGDDHQPVELEWQQLLTSRGQGVGGGFLYTGPGRCLSHCSPESLAPLNLEGCSAVILLDGSHNDTSYRRQSKADAKKIPQRLELERAHQSAALFSLCGALSIVTTDLAIGFYANQLALKQIFEEWTLDDKATLGKAVRQRWSNPSVKPRVKYATVMYGLPAAKFKA